jgi:hypothetical protein
MKASNIYCLVGLVTIGLFCPTRMSAQTANRAPASSTIEVRTQAEELLLRTLVDEVRQLRLTLQRTTLGAYRFQLSFERLRLQQARVDSMTRELESVRLQLDNTKFTRTQFGARAKETQEQLDQEQDVKRRGVLEQQIKEFKRMLSTQTQQEERQTERQMLLHTQLQAEQLKLSDLNNQLDYVERELTTASNAGAKNQ